jgi:hypothetical protein
MNATDQRVQLAREYLDGARQRPVEALPPSRLVAELAETRRQLAAVLAVLEGREQQPQLQGGGER